MEAAYARRWMARVAIQTLHSDLLLFVRLFDDRTLPEIQSLPCGAEFMDPEMKVAKLTCVLWSLLLAGFKETWMTQPPGSLGAQNELQHF